MAKNGVVIMKDGLEIRDSRNSQKNIGNIVIMMVDNLNHQKGHNREWGFSGNYNLVILS